MVTGASKGVGAAIARELGARGARVVVDYASSRQGAYAVVAAIVANGGQSTAVQASVSERRGCAACLRHLPGKGSLEL